MWLGSSAAVAVVQASAPILPLAWELPYAAGVAIKFLKIKQKIIHLTRFICPHHPLWLTPSSPPTSWQQVSGPTSAYLVRFDPCSSSPSFLLSLHLFYSCLSGATLFMQKFFQRKLCIEAKDKLSAGAAGRSGFGDPEISQGGGIEKIQDEVL